MRIVHRLKGQSAIKEINESTPLGLFASNKIGGLLYLDVLGDKAQYYAKLADKTVKILHNIKSDEKVEEIENRFHSVKISRGQGMHEIFVPYYMNGLLINTNQEGPFQIELEPKELEKEPEITSRKSNKRKKPAKLKRKNKVYQKNGRVLIRSSGGETDFHIAIQGEKLNYDCKEKKGKILLGLQAEKVAIAIENEEEKAIGMANHLFANHNKIREVQEKYISPTVDFEEEERALAYTCVLNGTDNMFVQEGKKVFPIPYFSKVTDPHPSLAAHALLLEGEYGMVKDTLLADLERLENSRHAAWPLLMLGRLLDDLCATKKLYKYFSKEEIQKLASKVSRLVDRELGKGISASAKGKRERQKSKDRSKLENKALKILMYNLAYALSKNDKYLKAEQELKEEAQKDCSAKIRNLRTEVSKESVESLFLTAYIYPKLLSNEAWKECFDTVLNKLHGNLKTMRNKLAGDEKKKKKLLELEVFGLMSMAATVLSRTDDLHYLKQIRELADKAVEEVLFKGIIGRPSSSYEHNAEPEKGPLIKDNHLANNALFLEMIRECS